MADFTSSIQTVQGQVNPVQPVENNTTANAINSVGGLLGNIGAAVINANTYADQVKQAKDRAKPLGTLEQNILRNADLHDQGILTQDQARRNIRRMAAQALANHPMLQDDINNLVSKTMSTVGLAADVVTGTQEEQDKHTNQQKVLQAAQQNGYGSPNDPPEVQQKMAMVWQGVQLAKAQLNQQKDVIEFEKSQTELTNSRLATVAAKQGIANNAVTAQRNKIGLRQDIHKLNFTQNIADLTAKWEPQYVSQMEKIRNNSELTPDQKAAAYDGVQASMLSAATAVAIGADKGDAANSIANIFKARTDLYKAEALGTIKKEALTAELANLQLATQVALSKKDPAFLKATSISKLLPTGMTALQEIISNKAGDILSSHGELPGVDGGVSKIPASVVTDGTQQSVKDVKQVGAVLLENVKQFNSGNVKDPEHLKQLNTTMTNFVKSFAIHGTTATDATDLKTAVGILADSNLGLYLHNPQNTVPREVADKAHEIFNTAYKAELVPLFQDEFVNNDVKVGEKPAQSSFARAQGVTEDVNAPTPSQISVNFSDGRAVFVANDPSNNNAVAQASRLNKKVSPIIGQMVRAEAHINGSIDYDKYGNALLLSLENKGVGE